MKPVFKKAPVFNYTSDEEGTYFTVKDTAHLPEDLERPATVYDLAVKHVFAENGSIAITFTAVGDDLDEGTGKLLHRFSS